MANGTNVQSSGQAIGVPIQVNEHKSQVDPHLLENLSYDLILGRDWCKANGLVIDFNKEKIYFTPPTEKMSSEDLINEFSMGSIENAEFGEFNPRLSDEYAMTNEEIILPAYHEVKVSVFSKQTDTSSIYIQNYIPLVELFGVFVVKGIVQFKNNHTFLMLSDLTKTPIRLPKGTIVAVLESFEDEDWKKVDESSEATQSQFVVDATESDDAEVGF